MTAPVPPLTPYLVVSNAAAAVEFYRKAFGATQDGEAHIMPGTNKIMHVRLLINGSLVMLADDFSEKMGSTCQTPEALGGSPITLALNLSDVQSFWDRAVAGGVTVTMPLADMFWGDRYGQVTDPFGHKWSMSQTIADLTDAQMQSAAENRVATKGTLMGDPVAS
jgi:PhnB protein